MIWIVKILVVILLYRFIDKLMLIIKRCFCNSAIYFLFGTVGMTAFDNFALNVWIRIAKCICGLLVMLRTTMLVDYVKRKENGYDFVSEVEYNKYYWFNAFSSRWPYFNIKIPSTTSINDPCQNWKMKGFLANFTFTGGTLIYCRSLWRGLRKIRS